MSDFVVEIKRFVVEIKKQDIEIDIKPNLIEIEIDRSVVSMCPEYTGETIVTPLLDERVILDTNLKTLKTNIEVKKIPWEEVSNPQGGLTVTIGGY